MREADSPSLANSFVGRERELGELRRAVDQTNRGHGHLFLVSGEPGIGKTRLADELASEAASRGMRVVWGRCWEGGGAPAYWPWIQVIRGCLNSAGAGERRTVLEAEHASSTIEAVAQIVPELRAFAPHSLKPAMTARLDAEQTQFRLFDSVGSLLKDFARSQPLLVLLDDLHDADDASLMMLRLIAQGLTGAGMVIVGTYREGEVRRSPMLGKHMGDLSREARCIPLAGLSEAEVAQFIAVSSGQTPDDKLVARLHAATAGNPLFVDGVMRMLIADRSTGDETAFDRQFKIPDTVREAIRRRLATLSDETHSLLKVAAVIGNEFEADLCLRVGEVSRDQFNLLLDEASAGGIAMSFSPGRYRFAHALVRAAIYDALDTNTRLQLHGRLAETIEVIHADDLQLHLAELAHHFREAGVIEKAIEYSDRAAKAAAAVFAYAVAARHWRAALALSDGQNDSRRADLLFDLGREAALRLDPAEGIAFLEAALSLYRKLQNDERVAIANATLGLALAAHPGSSPGMYVPRALEHFREALAWKGEWTDLKVLGLLHKGMAASLFYSARLDEAIAAAELAKRIFQPDWISASSLICQLLMVKGRHREVAALSDEIWAVVEDVSDPEGFRYAMYSAGWYRLLMRDPIEAKRFFTIGMNRPGLATHQREIHFTFLTLTEHLAGDLSRAEALAAEHPVNPLFRSFMEFRKGNWEAAIEMQLGVLEWARRTGHRWDQSNVLSILFESFFVIGDLRRATGIFRQALRTYEPSDFFWEIRNRPEAALLSIAAGRFEEAVQHLEVCRTIMAQGEDWLGRAGFVARAEGVVAAAQGHDFATHFEKAVAILKRYCLPWDEADTLYYWGKALNGVGEYSGANEKFDTAIEIYRRHGGGQRWIDRVEAARASRPNPLEFTESPTASPGSPTFVQEGDFWTITHGSRTFRLRNFKGLTYIAYLLAHPGVRIHVYDLVAMVEGGATQIRGAVNQARADGLEATRDLGDAGETLDPQAISEYRLRLGEVREELAIAERNNDSGAIDRARYEFDLLSRQLTAGVGRGGRARRSSSHAERARAQVTKNIRASVAHIRRNDVKLGDHLASGIRTGAFCAYLPNLANLANLADLGSLPNPAKLKNFPS